jgi:hypothetical protein
MVLVLRPVFVCRFDGYRLLDLNQGTSWSGRALKKRKKSLPQAGWFDARVTFGTELSAGLNWIAAIGAVHKDIGCAPNL